MRFASSDRLAKLQSLEPTQSENPRPTGRRSRRETSKWLSFLNENVYACLHKARDRAQRKEKRRKNRFDFQYCKRKLWNFVYICNIYECVCVWVCSKYKTMFTSLTKYERCVPFCLFIFGKYKLCTSNLLPIISFTNTSRLSLRYRMAKRKASADFSLSLPLSRGEIRRLKASASAASISLGAICVYVWMACLISLPKRLYCSPLSWNLVPWQYSFVQPHTHQYTQR